MCPLAKNHIICRSHDFCFFYSLNMWLFDFTGPWLHGAIIAMIDRFRFHLAHQTIYLSWKQISRVDWMNQRALSFGQLLQSGQHTFWFIWSTQLIPFWVTTIFFSSLPFTLDSQISNTKLEKEFKYRHSVAYLWV